MADNTRGAVLMTATMAAFTLNDAFIKVLSAQLPLSQILTLRGVASTLCLTGIAIALGSLTLQQSARDWRFIALRTVSEVAAAYFFLTALFNVPLANATAILQSAPLVITLAGAVFFKEAIGWRRLSAILIGLIGVLLIVRPGTDGFDIFAIYALIAVVCVTARDIATRKVGATVPSLTMAVVGSAGVTVAAALASSVSPESWRPVTMQAGWLLAGSTVSVVFAYLFSVMVMRVGDIGFVAPFRYTGLVWALGLGLVVFGDWPDPLTLIGASIVVGTGLFAFFRERTLARS
ncbi:DMT family transporter [Actibacterium sp. 188UL27-1]|nr:DMT family transporter [Actibacterium sp. 188UL27-1]MBM7068491.1 DMT family transporter [Actibacterium sp. 188UL27-1]